MSEHRRVAFKKSSLIKKIDHIPIALDDLTFTVVSPKAAFVRARKFITTILTAQMANLNRRHYESTARTFY